MKRNVKPRDRKKLCLPMRVFQPLCNDQKGHGCLS